MSKKGSIWARALLRPPVPKKRVNDELRAMVNAAEKVWTTRLAKPGRPGASVQGAPQGGRAARTTTIDQVAGDGAPAKLMVKCSICKTVTDEPKRSGDSQP